MVQARTHTDNFTTLKTISFAQKGSARNDPDDDKDHHNSDYSDDDDKHY